MLVDAVVTEERLVRQFLEPIREVEQNYEIGVALKIPDEVTSADCRQTGNYPETGLKEITCDFLEATLLGINIGNVSGGTSFRNLDRRVR